MAAPPEMHLGNLTGKFIMNSRMSASIDDVLAAQGVGYLKRKAIQLATIYLTIDHGKTDTGVERIKIQSSASGLKGADEEYIFDGITRERNHEVYGYIKASSKRMPMQDVTEAYLKEGWIEDEFGKSGGIVYVHSEADMSLNTGDQWTAIQVNCYVLTHYSSSDMGVPDDRCQWQNGTEIRQAEPVQMSCAEYG